MRSGANAGVRLSRVPAPIFPNFPATYASRPLPEVETQFTWIGRRPQRLSRPFLNGWNAYKFLVKQKIVKNLQRAREKERHVDPGGPRKHEPDE
jgi:hypothetical protein